MKPFTRPTSRGQGIVEFALILSILLLFLMVIFDAGRAVYAYSVIYNAAREGARYGVTHPESASGIEVAARRLTAGLNGSLLTVATDYPYTGGLRVTVSYTFTPATPVFALLRFDNNTIALTSRSIMQIEE